MKLLRTDRLILNCLTICLIISFVGGGLALLGYIFMGRILLGFGIKSGGLCIIILASVKLVKFLRVKIDEN